MKILLVNSGHFRGDGRTCLDLRDEALRQSCEADVVVYGETQIKNRRGDVASSAFGVIQQNARIDRAERKVMTKPEIANEAPVQSRCSAVGIDGDELARIGDWLRAHEDMDGRYEWWNVAKRLLADCQEKQAEVIRLQSELQHWQTTRCECIQSQIEDGR